MAPVLVPDMGAATEERWLAFGGAVLDEGVRGVFALPLTMAAAPIGALDLFRHDPGSLAEDALDGGLIAAELATLPLMDLMSGDVDWAELSEGGEGWGEGASLERVEVYQATGMIVDQLDVGAAEAVLRLRAHAFSHGLTASEVAWSILERRLSLGDDDPQGGPG